MKDILITLLNIAFWFGLHFGTAGAVCALPKDVQTRWFDPNRRFFTVSDWEMRFFRAIGLPKWKDRLPQFNPEFDKRYLANGRDPAYLDRFLFITCRAEVIHYAGLAVAVFLSAECEPDGVAHSVCRYRARYPARQPAVRVDPAVQPETPVQSPQKTFTLNKNLL